MNRPTAYLVVLLLSVAGCQSTGGSSSGQQPGGGPTAEKKPAAPEIGSTAQLRAALHDPDLMTRMRAVEELGRRAPTSQEAVDALVEALGDKEPLIRRFAAGGLAGLPSPSAPTVGALARLLRDSELDPRERASWALATLAPRVPAESVADLAAMLAAAVGDSEASVRAHAVEALGGLGARGARAAPSVKPALERALGDSSENVRAAAAAAAGELGAGTPGAIALLIRALADPVHDVRKFAVIAVEKIGPDAAGATKALLPLLRGKEIYLRVFAADALTAIGPAARAALPELKAMVARGWKEIRNSPEYEAKQLPDAVAKAIRSIEAKDSRKGTKAP